jgi:hypothetical protein
MDLDVDANFGACLLDRSVLSLVQQIIRAHAPVWSRRLRLWEAKKGAPRIDLNEPSSLYDTVEFDVSTKGPFYQELVRQFGPPAHRGVSGTLEFRGADRSITVIVHVDDRKFLRVGDLWTWGNSIAFQLRASVIEGIDADVFAGRLFEELCSKLAPSYAHAESSQEFEAKNISHLGGGTEAIGVDISKSLPGLYWLNYFGEECANSMGKDAFAASGTTELTQIGAGYRLTLSRRPSDWNTTWYKENERRAMKSLGEDFFFHRERPEQQTKSPFIIDR